MHIWVDADACPKIIKDILYRAADRVKVPLILVANQPLTAPSSPLIKKIQVPPGFDVADNYIVKNVSSGDLVITADIPLVDAVIEKNAHALNPRGQWYSQENVKQRLSMRNFSESLRSSGIKIGGPSQISQREIQTFANCLDTFLTRNI